MSDIIEGRKISKDLVEFSNAFKVGDKNLGTIISELEPIIEEAYSEMSNYLKNSKNDITNVDVSEEILSVEENI